MKGFTSSVLSAAAAFLYLSSSSVDAQSPFAAPRAAVNGTTGQVILPVQSIPSCAYVNANGTYGTPLIYDLYATQNASTVVNSTSTPTAEVCYVWDPLRTESPWANSTFAYPQAFEPSQFVCTVTNFLCPINVPYACGRQCFTNSNFTCVVNENSYFDSYLVPAISNCTAGPFTVPPPAPTQPTPSYPKHTVQLVPAGSQLANSPTSVSSATPAPTPVPTAGAIIANASIAPVEPVNTPAPTVPVGPTQSVSANVVPQFSPVGTPVPTAPAAAGSNRLLHRLSRFF